MSDIDARRHLAAAGYTILPGRWIRLPSPEHDVTEAEMQFVRTLVYEHDYPGFESRYMIDGGDAYRAGLLSTANPYTDVYDGGYPRRNWGWGWEVARIQATGGEHAQ